MAAMLAILLLNVLLLSICATTILAANIAKPNCTAKCGNVNITYPFGIGKGCYLDKGFEIECKLSNTSNSLQPFLVKAGGVLVQEITLDSVYVGHWKTSTCYSERESKGNETYNLKGGPFSLSSIENKLTAIGCDIYAYITDADTRNRTSGCISLCEESNSYNTSGSCSGSGCCQTNIPTGMTTFEVGMISINTENKVWNSSGDYCSTAMIEEGLKVDRGIDVYEGSQNYSQRSGLEWWIGNETGIAAIAPLLSLRETPISLMVAQDYPDVALASVRVFYWRRRTREDDLCMPAARACTPYGLIFRCALGTVETDPDWAMIDGIRASVKIDLREFDSSWTWQVNELRATGAVIVFYSQIPQVTQVRVGMKIWRNASAAKLLLTTRIRRVKFEAEIHKILNSRATKALRDSKEERTGVTQKGVHLLDEVADIIVRLSGSDTNFVEKNDIPYVSWEKVFCSRMQCISEGAVQGCTAHIFIRRLKVAEHYPEEKADS
ncbi:hypothetical protein GIB67_004070 [Kingdonia uniflora]|uniref:Wall-associated receptor kinase galacturonan-binding domain-containing protein n=1 Tax=Kingdonia uniflora TaxID=39325 RepID=A0A7J7NRX7_9MAGN|nr:hypothetical protein GIB67_004070 [Kingdonia uniflora]